MLDPASRGNIVGMIRQMTTAWSGFYHTGDCFTKVIVIYKIVSIRSVLRFPYVHVYVRFTKLVLRVTTYDLRQVTSPIMEVKRYYIVSYILYIINPTAQKLIRGPGGSMS